MNRSLHWKLPLLLYLLTWVTACGLRFEDGSVLTLLYLALSTSLIDPQSGTEYWLALGRIFFAGFQYASAVMLILTCHEFGHYFQMRRYGVSGSLPYFIPMPLGPFGTMGAVIAMDGRIPNRRALFDIGISGPLAGLIPTLILLYYGVKWSYIGPCSGMGGAALEYGEPLIFQWVSHWIYGPLPGDLTLFMHPVGKAAWVGLFLTSLNLMPLGQLDGGHVFYALFGRHAAFFSKTLFYAAIALVVLNWQTLGHWTLILILLCFIGVTHPPTADDTVQLTPLRRLLGVGILAFIFFGFTPVPLDINAPEKIDDKPRWYCRDETGTQPFCASSLESAEQSDEITAARREFFGRFRPCRQILPA